MAANRTAAVKVRAFAKLNLTLRILGLREDGYHSLRTTFQSLALHDTLTFRPTRDAFLIECDDAACPTDRTNLVWRAAHAVWRAAGRHGPPSGVLVRIVKRIPLQAGLGGGSSDAAAAIRALTALWRVDLSAAECHEMAASLGADVPFFLEGGAALGLDKGDLLFPLADRPEAWVTLVIPEFGVSTKDAYAWWDGGHDAARVSDGRRALPRGARAAEVGRMLGLPTGELCNDLEPQVAAHHPEIEQMVRALRRCGARYAAMSGSGSAVFGLFDSRKAADAAGRSLNDGGWRVVVTQTTNRARYRAMARPAFVRGGPRRSRI